MKTQNILVVDDHEMVLDGITDLLGGIFHTHHLDKEQDPNKAVSRLKARNYDILISDYEMPGMNGRELTKIARECQPEIKVLILSMHDEPYIVNSVIELNVDGYVLKSNMHLELEMALDKISNGNHYFSAEIAQLCSPSRPPDTKLTLSNRELEILRLIVQKYTTVQIAQHLYLNLKTVETHEKNMARKMRVDGRPGLLKYANDHGLFN